MSSGFVFDKEMGKRERSFLETFRTKCPGKHIFLWYQSESRRRSYHEKYVLPGTIIFSDKWAGYIDLNKRFKRFTVTHNERFVKYIFFKGRKVLTVTTNHIERVWVEVRRKLRGVKRGDVPDRINEVLFRNLKLRNQRHQEIIVDFIRDIMNYHAHKMGSRHLLLCVRLSIMKSSVD